VYSTFLESGIIVIYLRLRDDIKVIHDDALGCCDVDGCAVLDGLSGLEGADAAASGLTDEGCCGALPLSSSKSTSSSLTFTFLISWKSRMAFAVNISSRISRQSCVLYSGQGTRQLKQTGMSTNQSMTDGSLTKYATSLFR